MGGAVAQGIVSMETPIDALNSFGSTYSDARNRSDSQTLVNCLLGPPPETWHEQFIELSFALSVLFRNYAAVIM